MRRQCSPYVFLLNSPPDFNSSYMLTGKQALAQCDRTALKITAILEWDKHSVREEFLVLTPPRRRWLQAGVSFKESKPQFDCFYGAFKM